MTTMTGRTEKRTQGVGGYRWSASWGFLPLLSVTKLGNGEVGWWRQGEGEKTELCNKAHLSEPWIRHSIK